MRSSELIFASPQYSLHRLTLDFEISFRDTALLLFSSSSLFILSSYGWDAYSSPRSGTGPTLLIQLPMLPIKPHMGIEFYEDIENGMIPTQLLQKRRIEEEPTATDSKVELLSSTKEPIWPGD